MKKLIFLLVGAWAMLPAFSQSNQKGLPFPQGPYLGQKPPGNIPELFARGIVSTQLVEHGTVTFSPDGAEVFWAMIYNDPFRKKIMTMKRINNIWTAPEIASFSLGENEGNPFFAPDGKKIYFSGWRKADGYGENKHLIMFSEKTENGWSAPKLIDRVINSISKFWHISVAANGNLYFCSEKDDGGIFCSKYIHGEYALPEKIDVGFKGGTTVIAADERYLIFSVFASPDGIGGGDLYISFRKDDLTWTSGKNLGAAINSDGDDLWPIVSPDGKFLFFTSSRNGSQDIYWVNAKIIEGLKPKEEK
ncbi:MAG: PD40 domain-containing protein [Candidatus Aminicenantes bacterium]|nr:PD40 domain-containing protein [Candidatus Aminicenantes bacterium]